MHTLTGNPATSRSSPLAVSAVSDGDAGSAANLADTPLQPILDVLAFLQAQAARLDLANTFTQTQLFQAAVTLSALLTANANVSLAKAGDQSILKGGSGKFQVGTSTATDLELLVGGVVKAVLSASTGRLGGLTDPAAAQDAATKAYVDAATVAKAYTDASSAKAWGSINCGAAGAATINNGFNLASASYSGTSLTVNFTNLLPTSQFAVIGSMWAITSTKFILNTSSRGTGSIVLQVLNNAAVAQNWASGDQLTIAVFGA